MNRVKKSLIILLIVFLVGCSNTENKIDVAEEKNINNEQVIVNNNSSDSNLASDNQDNSSNNEINDDKILAEDDTASSKINTSTETSDSKKETTTSNTSSKTSSNNSSSKTESDTTTSNNTTSKTESDTTTSNNITSKTESNTATNNNTTSKTESNTTTNNNTTSKTESNTTTNNDTISKTSDNQETSSVSDTPSNKEDNVVSVTLVSSENSEELINDYSKYGTVYKVYQKITTDTYSDGTTKVIKKGTRTEFDASGFNAKTADMLAEAKESASSYSTMINDIVSFTNSYRAEKGVDNLTLDSTLTNLACVRAIEMAWADNFSHTRPDGSMCFTVLSDGGLQPYGAENIAYGQRSAESVSNSWKNSSGHYANMINDRYTKIGVGVYKFDGVYYFVQLFQ